MMDPRNYVRVTQYTNQEIVGRYDGVNYVFPDSHDGAYLDCEKIVALHVFGYMGTEEQKQTAVLRLGWVNRMPIEDARRQLDECVAFHDVPAFPATISEFRRPRDPAQRVPHTPEQEGQRAAPSASEESPGDFSPFEKESARKRR
jgi:hypothetical protein